jgi:hypothetical protein
MQESHRHQKNKFAHAPTRRAEYFNQLELKKSFLLELENDNGNIDAPQSLPLRTGARRPLSTQGGTPLFLANGLEGPPAIDLNLN